MHNWRRYSSSNWYEIDQKHGSKLALCCGAIWRHREKPQYTCTTTIHPVYKCWKKILENLLPVWLVKKQTPHFRTCSRRELYDLPQTLHGDRAHRAHQKRCHSFFDPTYSFSYRVYEKIWPNLTTRSFSTITPAKFYLNRCNESPLRGEKPDFWPVIKNSTGSFPLRGSPAGN